jgi:hypothetical protein
MNKRIHIIPVGANEPVHTAHETCRCQPLLDEDGLMIHHAEDLREARERHDRNRPDEKWVLVEEVVANIRNLPRDENGPAS